jgi:hypothetical protein
MKTTLLRVAPLLSLLLLLGCQETPVDADASDSDTYLEAPSTPPDRQTPTQPNKATPQRQQASNQQSTGRVVIPKNAPANWKPAVTPHAWKYIVIHHSDTDSGSAAAFDRYHREVKHWDGLGYDFVIGNGRGAPDGQVQVGPRWVQQKIGAHAGVREYNENGIGICLVGDFDHTQPTATQMEALARLVGYLMHVYHIPPSNVIGHRDAKHTNCPGRYMSIAKVRLMAAAYAGIPLEDASAVASGELLRDSK